MRWELEEEQGLYQESLRGWMDKAADGPAVRGWYETGDPSEFERRFVSEGWFAVGSPEDRGGQGGGLLELTLTAEELARRAAPSAAWLASVIALPGLPRDVATRVLEGDGFVALAIDASRPVEAPSGIRLDESDALRGSVSMVLGADRAARLLVPVQSTTGPQLRLVDVSEHGVRLTSHELLDRSRSLADVTLDGVVGVRVDPAETTVEEFLVEAALRAAVLTSADALGAMHRMLDLAVEYSLQRHQFGVPIGSFQAVKHAAASILVAVEAARSIVYFAAASIDAGQADRAVHAAIAKAQVTASGVQAADTALTMHGAIGYTWEHDLHLLYKRAKLDDRLFGPPSLWNERVADALELATVGAHS